jgi:hypothetical protein
MKGYIMPKRYPMTTRITFDGRRIRVTPVKYYDEVLPEYFMDKDGNIYRKNDNGTRLIKTRMSGQQTYPHVTVRTPLGKNKSLGLHRLVAFTLVPFVPPDEISEDEWAYVCKHMPTTKKFIEEYTQVNHKDADHENYHPSNLEWLSGRSNRKAYYRDHVHTHKTFISKCGLDLDFKMSKQLRKA